MQKLKLSKETVAVLKNFNQINPMLLFKKGNVISTISPGKTILAKYKSPEKFNSEFGIYKLDKLLSILSFFAEPEITIDEKHITIKDDNQSAKIALADPSVIVYPQKDEIDLPTIDAEFDITEGQINDITKAYSIMGLPFVAFEGDAGKQTLFLKALDYKNPTGDDYTIEIDTCDRDFTALFNINNLKMIPADYHVEVSAKGISKFSNGKMTYFVAVEKDSNFA